MVLMTHEKAITLYYVAKVCFQNAVGRIHRGRRDRFRTAAIQNTKLNRWHRGTTASATQPGDGLINKRLLLALIVQLTCTRNDV